ncbi:hypothetical protein RHMOL_Rhmol12G0058900 [Rhododendron molle]|uniref:Uncharacterized protein n=1 Tax=Rhododendron molle TaxID=49168 RepID=A0ACC0LFS5_RHOML|nr:hypothetical protein RHMOL_Rhmol12G0058900 [Rhododendron molle]
MWEMVWRGKKIESGANNRCKVEITERGRERERRGFVCRRPKKRKEERDFGEKIMPKNWSRSIFARHPV